MVKITDKRIVKAVLKSALLCVLSVITLLVSSCSGDDDRVVYTFDEKIITASMYNCFYSRSKENMLSVYKQYDDYYGSKPEEFKKTFGYLPDGSEGYWENTFWGETLTGYNKTAREVLLDMTERACKEYLVYEKIARDYGYGELSPEIENYFEKTKNEEIAKFGSYEAWNIATLGKYGITAKELIEISVVSSYGTVLPSFIFGEKGEKISDEEALKALSDSVQFMYSVYYFQTDTEVVEPSEEVSESSSEEMENNVSVSEDEESENDDIPTVEDYNKHYKELMYSNYEKVMRGEMTFEDVYKDSDEYKALEDKAPNGVVLSKEYFNTYFSLELTEFKIGEIILVENEAGVFMIKFVDFTSEYISEMKSSLIDSSFEKILQPYLDQVAKNKDVLSALNK